MLGALGGRSGSRMRRSCDTYACSEAMAAGGAESPHSTSTSRSTEPDPVGFDQEDGQQLPLQPGAQVEGPAVQMGP